MSHRKTNCVGCGSTEIEWWRGRYADDSRGAHRVRCHDCYLARVRDRQNAAGHGRLIGPPKPAHLRHRPGPKLGPPKPPKPRARRTAACACGVVTEMRNEHATCAECAARNAGAAEARRRQARRDGDRPHWSDLGPHDNWTCHLCGFDVLPVAGGAGQPWGATVDHVLPIALGGEDVWTNVRLAHRWCNSKRAQRDPDEVSAEIAYLVWTMAPPEVTGRFRLPAA